MLAPATEPATSSSPASAQSDLAARPIKVVPRGLCSFDEHDADFFLELLPGPRDRDGLPDGLRFWKTRIEATEAREDVSHRADLWALGVRQVVAPEGRTASPARGRMSHRCMSRQPRPIRKRACCGGLRKVFPAIPGDSGLVEALAFLRRNHSLLLRRKVILVLDQFEQWLFAHGRDEGTELVAALRQCDGRARPGSLPGP